MLFLVYTNHDILYKKDNKIYSTDGDIKAIHFDWISQDMEYTEIKATYKGTGNLEYRFVNSMNLNKKSIFIVTDIPETIVNICKMASTIDYGILVSYLEIDWITQSATIDSLLDDIPDQLDLLDFEGSIRLNYCNQEDVLYTSMMKYIADYLEYYYEYDEPDMMVLIDISDNIDKLLEKCSETYDSELINKLQNAASDILLTDDVYSDEIFDAIFAEYHWNNYFESKDFNMIDTLREE